MAIDPQERLAAKQVLANTEALARELDIPAREALMIRQLIHLRWIENLLVDVKDLLTPDPEE